MNGSERVSSLQMMVLFLFFMTGSSIVIVPAPLTNVASNGAWVALLIALAAGMALLYAVLYMYRRFPNESLVVYSRSLIGNALTFLLLAPFLVVLFWNVAGIVIEIGIFFKSTMLKETPTYAVNSLLFVTIALTVRAGLETMSRMAAMLLILMFAFIVVVCLLVANLYHPEYLLPVMPDGIGPVLNAAYIVYGFPYSELVVFAILLPCVKEKESRKVGKHLYLALTINGLTLLASIVCSIMVLGPLSGDLKYSLYQLARLIFIQEIIERIESVIGFSLIVGFYFKASILLLILVRMLTQLLKLKNERMMVFPVAFVCLLLSLTTYTNEAALEEIVNTIWPLLNNLVYVLPLLLLAVVSWFRRKGVSGRRPRKG
ncbi:GerAB/ArcD/ProY family transporter [Cohnella herbarum]|uniref:Endospore germination permease n=1 Tax=Cohnella herbarum TaxID=2728023 RepID=A0A7Z2VGL4_9BACL|nr:endospore germination permease [Cohnella herbarum]QJD82826.1 endospore germination permease [Cohnella herbarum]